MSDNNDETIGADPEDLAALIRLAADRQAEVSANDDPPLVIWTPGTDEPGTDDPGTDDPLAADVDVTRLPREDDDDDVTRLPLNAAETIVMSSAHDVTVPLASWAADTPSNVEAAASSVQGPVNTKNDNAAREFVRESLAKASEEEPEKAAPTSKPRRSGLWIAVAVVLGAQIVAGGLYLALTALGGDGEQPGVDQVVVETDADGIAIPTATTAPIAGAGPASEGTPTPVPPTPSWRPVNDGPRAAPFTFIVEAIVNNPTFYAIKGGEAVEPEFDGQKLPLANPLASGQPLVLRVVGGEPGDEWAQVALPGDAQAVAWIRGDEFVWSSTTRLVQIDIATNTLSVFDENNLIFRAPVASGIRSRPTPQLSTFVFEEIGSLGQDVPRRLRFAGFGGRAADSDGLGGLTIEPSEDSSQLNTEAGYDTDGRILLLGNDYAQLADLIDAGAKVEVLGVPTQPTPTPNPALVAGSGDFGSSGFVGCPPATDGVPPNCYRVVERTTVPGECEGLQVAIDGDCMIFGGDPELDAFGKSCSENAPIEIDERCYVRIGRLPELPGPCPEGSSDVRDECREPV